MQTAPCRAFLDLMPGPREGGGPSDRSYEGHRSRFDRCERLRRPVFIRRADPARNMPVRPPICSHASSPACRRTLPSVLPICPVPERAGKQWKNPRRRRAVEQSVFALFPPSLPRARRHAQAKRTSPAPKQTRSATPSPARGSTENVW